MHKKQEREGTEMVGEDQAIETRVREKCESA